MLVQESYRVSESSLLSFSFYIPILKHSYSPTRSLNAPISHELYMCLSVPNFFHQEMGTDGFSLISLDSVIINEVIGMDHYLSPRSNETADTKSGKC